MTAVGKRIRKTESASPPKKRSRRAAPLGKADRWESRILLYLEGEDPQLLDKETQKVYFKIDGTGAKIQGPVPLPAQRLPASRASPNKDRLHRRMFRILYPTEQTVSLLEKLALSGSVQTSISVEEIEAGDDP
jgi:small subunit ribosomal protein S10